MQIRSRVNLSDSRISNFVLPHNRLESDSNIPVTYRDVGIRPDY